MKIYNLLEEKAKRDYNNKDMFYLMEAMVQFLQHNPMPITNVKNLKQGMEIFAVIHKKAITNELRDTSMEYIKMYKKQYELLDTLRPKT